MCLIIYKPADKEVEESQLRRGFMSNPNGAGIMYSKDGKLIVEKGLFNVQAVIDRVKAIDAELDTHICIHFRLATSGNQDKDNCHPFKVNKNLAVMHNGIFGAYSYHNTPKSDTWMFTEQVLQTLPKDFINKSGTRFLLEKYCKSELSKLVFMNNKGEVDIVNEKAGSWSNGLWFSSGYYGTYSAASHYGAGYCNTSDAWDDDYGYNSAQGKIWQKCDCCSELKAHCMSVTAYIICEDCWNTIFSSGKYCSFCGHAVEFDTELACPICHTQNNVLDILCQHESGGNS